MWRDFFDFEDSGPLQVPVSGVEKAATEFLGFGVEIWAAIVGAILGSLLGGTISGLISYALQRKASKESELIRREERDLKRKLVAHSLLFKLAKLCEKSSSLWWYLESAQQTSSQQNIEPWGALRVLANLPDKVEFTDEEMSFLLSFENGELFGNLFLLDASYSSMVDLVSTMSTELEALLKELRLTGFEGNSARVQLTTQETLTLKPRMIAINALFRDGYPESKSICLRAIKVTNEIGKLFHKELGLKNFPLVNNLPRPKEE